MNKKQLNKELKEFVVPNVVNKKAQSLPKKIIFLGIMILLIGVGVWFVMGINFTPVYPTTNITTNESFVNITTNFSTDSLKGLNYTINSVTQNIADYTLQAWCNLNNNSNLLENATKIHCWNTNGGINGTLVSTTSVTNNGCRDSNCRIFRVSSNDAITIPSPLMNYSNGSMSVWVFVNQSTYQSYGRIVSANSNGQSKFELMQDSSYNGYRFSSCNATGSCTEQAISGLSNGLNNIVVTWNGSGIINNQMTARIYINGIYNVTKSVYFPLMGNNVTLGCRADSLSSCFNGTLDDVKFYNRTLTANEISSQFLLTKNNLTDYYLYVNQSLNYSSLILNFSNPVFVNNYNFCISNGTIICSTQQSINQTIRLKNISANFSSSIGKLNDYFYGVGTYLKFMANDNNTGNIQTCTNQPVNVAWNRQMFLDSGMNVYRPRAYFNYIYLNYTDGNFVVNESELKLFADQVRWGYENNIMIMISGVNTPEFLQNRTSGYCNASFWASCPQNNLTVSDLMTLHFFNNITNYGEYKNVVFEVGNEYYTGDLVQGYWDFGWCNNVSTASDIKGVQYVRWFNSSRNAIKGDANLSWMPVVGPVGYLEGTGANLFTNTFLSNISSFMDGVVMHRYDTTPTHALYTNYVYNDTTVIIDKCNTYGANCSWIIFSEWNVGSNSLWNSTSQVNKLSNDYGRSFLSIMNSYPTNVSMILWHWSALQENEGWHDMVVQPECAEPLVYLRFAPSYNMTKRMSAICPQGSTVYRTSLDSCIQQTSCVKGSHYGIFLLNNCSESYNLTSYNISLNNGTVFYPYNNITNLITKKVYNVNNAEINLSSDSIMDASQNGGSNNMLFLSSGVPPTITDINPVNLTTNITSNQINFTANLTDDVGLTNSTLYLLNTTDNSLKTFFTDYVSGEKSVVQSFLVYVRDAIYKFWWSLFDDEGKETVSGNYTLYIQVPSNITFQSPTPTNNSIVFSRTQTIVANISNTLEQNTSSFMDFDKSLVGYFSFDYYNATHLFDNSSYGHSGYIFKGGINISTNGSRGSSFVFNQSTCIKINSPLMNYSNGTFSIWVYTAPYYYSGFSRIVSAERNTATANQWELDQSGDYNDYLFYTQNSSYDGHKSINANNLPDGWNNIVVTWNGSGIPDSRITMKIYANGVLKESTNLGYFPYMNESVTIGCRAWDGGNLFNGTADEFLVLNRTMELPEINSMYSSQINLFNSTISNLLDGFHNYTVYAIGQAGNFNSSSQNFEVDTTLPRINITYPLNTTYNPGITRINYTVNELNPSYCWFSNGTVNSSLVSSGTNFTTQSIEGLNTWIIFCNDTVNNTNSSSISFTQDTTPPIITITNPTTADENANPVNLIASTNEVSTCAYSLDSQANISMGTNTGFLVPITLSNGVHTIKVFCNDSLINQNTTGASISFNVYLGGGVTGGGGDTTTPIVNVTNTTIINNTTVIGNESEKFDGKIDLGDIKIGEFTIGTWALIGIIVGILFLILLAFIIDAIRKK